MMGIAIPPPLALIERRGAGCYSGSYFLAEYVEGPDGTVFADPAVTVERKRELAT